MNLISLTQEEIDNMSLRQLKEKYNVTEWTIRESIRSLGLKKSRYVERSSINREFFKIWSHDSAYVFGYFLGDGCYSKFNNHGRMTARVQFCSAERDNIQKIKDAMNSKHKITEHKQESREVNGRIVKGCIEYTLSISDKRFVANLEALGVDENKTRKGLRFYPTISKEYQADIARGLLDSDGCVNITPQGSLNLVWIFYEKNMLDWFSEFILVKYSIKEQITDSGYKLYKLCVWKQKDIEKLYKWMYYDGVEMFSKRKREKFEVKFNGN